MGVPLLLESTVLFDILSFLPSILLVFLQHITTIVQYMPPSSLSADTIHETHFYGLIYFFLFVEQYSLSIIGLVLSITL